MRSLVPLMAAGVFTLGCSGARSPELYRDDTMRLLNSQRGDVQACYERVLKTDPKAGGKVTVLFTIKEGSGALVDAKVDPANTSAPQAVQQCVLSSLQGLALKPVDKRRGEATWSWELSAAPPAK